MQRRSGGKQHLPMERERGTRELSLDGDGALLEQKICGDEFIAYRTTPGAHYRVDIWVSTLCYPDSTIAL
jgi:hypothetical protein